MNSRIRIATPDDATAFATIKLQLPMTGKEEPSSRGGFLLGTDLVTYSKYIENAFCLVAESDDEVIGFGIILTDKMLRVSDIWERRSHAKWNIHLPDYENKKLCYLEQFAVLTGHRRLAASLLYNLVKWVFDNGYDYLFTTTVKEPILNIAPLPFIDAVAGIKAGNIDEV